jgi:hypothetical protein
METNQTLIAPTPATFIHELLEHACPMTERTEGHTVIKTLWVETHCVGWTVEAYKDDFNEWVVLRATPEDC